MIKCDIDKRGSKLKSDVTPSKKIYEITPLYLPFDIVINLENISYVEHRQISQL